MLDFVVAGVPAAVVIVAIVQGLKRVLRKHMLLHPVPKRPFVYHRGQPQSLCHQPLEPIKAGG